MSQETPTVRKTENAVSGRSRPAENALRRVSAAALPDSINYVYTFAFRIGLFLILKCFLVLRYLGQTLTPAGILVVLGQFVLALTFCLGGVMMQAKQFRAKQGSAVFALGLFALGFIESTILCAFSTAYGWKFFVASGSSFILLDLLKRLGGALANIGLSVVFIDRDLWTLFALLTGLITWLYMRFEEQPGTYRRVTCSLAVWMVLLVLAVAGISVTASMREIRLPRPARVYMQEGWTAEAVMADLRSAGFTRITIERTERGIGEDYGELQSITADGRPIGAAESYPRKTEFVIRAAEDLPEYIISVGQDSAELVRLTPAEAADYLKERGFTDIRQETIPRGAFGRPGGIRSIAIGGGDVFCADDLFDRNTKVIITVWEE